MVIASASLARAQSMDYGALEQLFGESVTTAAIGTPQRARDVPAQMEIVTADDIRRSGAIDIPGVLAHVPGVDVSRWTNLGSDVSVRGNNSPLSPRLLVLVDGRQVYMDDYGRADWASLPVELAEIRQIEVVKGPNSALFGFNAAGGVVNIITYNPLYDTVNAAAVRFGTQRYQQGAAVATIRAGDDVAVRLSAGGTRTDDFRAVRATARDTGLPDPTTRDHVAADLHWRVSPAVEAELELTHGESAHLAETPVWSAGYLRQETSSVRGRVIADTAAGVVTAAAYTNWSNTQAWFTNFPSTAFDNRLTVASLEDVFQPATDHVARVSAEYRHSGMNTAPVGGGRLSYDIASLSGMWAWTVRPSLSLTAAGRVDGLFLHRDGAVLADSGLDNGLWSRRHVEPSYNFGAVWRADAADTLRLTASRGVQLPSLIELGSLQVQGQGFATLGNPQINPTIVDNYEIDWDRGLPALAGRSRIAAFFERTRNIASFVSPLDAQVTQAGSFVAFTGNVADSDEIGAEFSLAGRFGGDGTGGAGAGGAGGGFRWSLAYTPRLVRDAFRAGASYANTGTDFQHTTPRHVADASLGWSGGRWEADGFVRFQSSANGLFTQDTQTYAVVPIGPTVAIDGRVAYRAAEHVTLALTGQNVAFSSARQTVLGKLANRVLGELAVTF